MDKEFIPYEQALDLKELGFNESCFGYYNEKLELWGVNPSSFHAKNSDVSWNCKLSNIFNKSAKLKLCTTPLYQQAFRWFREKYKLHSRVFFDELKELNGEEEERYDFNIIEQWTIGKDYFDYSYGFKHLHSSRGIYKSYEEAELECLKKLIELVKELK